MQERRSNADRTAHTRAALLAAARQLFVQKGFAETGTPEIVAAAGITRGALYHHFADKSALFRAVVEREAQEVGQYVADHSPAVLPPRDALIAGATAFLDAMQVPGRTRLLLIEAPVVLGFAGADSLDENAARAELRLGLAAALPPETTKPLDALTELVSAAFDRAALQIDKGADRQAYLHALVDLIDAIIGK